MGSSGQTFQASAPVYTAPLPPPPPPPDYQPAAYPQQQPFYQPPLSSPQHAQYGTEKTIGVILLRKPKSLGRYDSWTAVITSNRVIFALMTAQMVTDAATQARTQAKSEGRGFWGQWEEQLKATFSYTQRYMTMDPNAVLAETPGNCFVDNNTVAEVKLKLKTVNRGQTTHTNEFEIEVCSTQGNYVFRMEERSQFVDLLKQVYGDRVKMPFGYLSSHGFKVKLF